MHTDNCWNKRRCLVIRIITNMQIEPECDWIRDERDTENKLPARGAYGPPGGAGICAGKPDRDWWRVGFRGG